MADGDNFLGVAVERNDGRLVENNPLPLHVDQGVCRPEINGKIGGKKRKESHGV
jgi:hypothetical protein